MPTGTGLSAQLMIGAESTWGTAVPPTRALEIENESMKADKQILHTRAITSEFARTGRSRHYIKGVGGAINLDFMNQGMGLLLNHMLGAATVAQVGTTTEWVQTHTPDPARLGGKSLTVQVGRPSVDGVVRAFTYPGNKISDWSLKQALDQNLKLSLTMHGKNAEDTATALATATFPANVTPLNFQDAVLTVGGTAIPLHTFDVAAKRALSIRRFLGNTMKEQTANGEFAITGQIVKEFEDLAIFADFLSGATASLVATWSYGTITGASTPYLLKLTIPAVEYTTAEPNVSNSDVIQQTIGWRALYNGTNPILTAEYRTSDVAL